MREPYTTSGCILIQLPAPPLLVQQVDERRKMLGVTKQEVYRRVLTDFLHRYSDHSPTCYATYM